MSRDPHGSTNRTRTLRIGAALFLAIFGISLRPLAAPASADSSPALSIGPVTATFYPTTNGFNQGSFDTSTLGSALPSTISTFPVLDFNPDVNNAGGGLPLACSNTLPAGVSANVRAFTDVLPNADGSCSYYTPLDGSTPFGADSTGVENFEAVFTANLYVASAGQVTLNVNSDDGFYMGFGPNINNSGETVSGTPSGVNVPSTTAVNHYSTVGGNNQVEAPTTTPITFNFPDQGVYPMEVDYFESREGSQTFVMSYGSTSSAIPIPAQPEVSSLAPLSVNSGGGGTITITGSNFLPSAQLVLTDENGNSTPAGGVTVSAGGTSISGTVPTDLAAGAYDVTVQDPARSASPVSSGGLTLFILPAGSQATVTQSTTGTSFDPTGSKAISLEDPATHLKKNAKLSGMGSITLAQYDRNPAGKVPFNKKQNAALSEFFDLHLSKNACTDATLALEQSKGVSKQIQLQKEIAAADARAPKKLLLAFNSLTQKWQKLPKQTITKDATTGKSTIQSMLDQSDPKAKIKPCDLTGDPMVMSEDVTAPAVSVLSATYAAGPNAGTPYTYGATSFSNEPVTFSVSADDSEDGSTDGSGVAAIWYQEGNADPVQIYNGAADDDPQTATGQFTISDDGAHTITIWAVDQLNNGAPGDLDPATGNSTYSPIFANANIDMTAPSITDEGPSPTAANSAGWYNAPVAETFSASDVTSGVNSPCTASAGASCTFTQSSGTQQGKGITISSGAVTDNAGNSNPGITSTGYNIDLTAPVTIASGANADNSSYTPGSWTNQNVTVTLSPSDATSGVQSTSYTLDGGSTQTYSAPLSVTSEGAHVIRYWSVDNAGNAETPHTFDITIDKTPPSTTATTTVGGSSYTLGTWARQAVAVTLTPSDALSGVAATYDTVDGTQQTYAGTFNVSGDGTHSVTYWSVDNAGNVEASHSITVMIDTTPPSIVDNGPTTKPNGNGWYSTPVTETFSASDATSGVAAPCVAAPGASCTVTQSTGTQQGKGITISSGPVTDVAGNSNLGISSSTYNIDTTVPTCSVTMSPSQIWPPNKTMVPVTATVTTTSGPSGALYVLQSLTTNEGSIGSESQGWTIGQASTSGKLLADRGGSGTGRVYTFTYLVTSGAGLTNTCVGTVTVPHDQGH